MKNTENRVKLLLSGGLALLLAAMQVDGWQRSMKYATSVHTSEIFQAIGVMEWWQCLLVVLLEWLILWFIIFKGFSLLQKKAVLENTFIQSKYVWPIATGALLVIYMLLLIGCYPGYYNYDGGNQLIQVLYKETPYSSHHPLLHTLIMGGIITFGYYLRSVDLTFGVFLYSAFQMTVCAACFGYAVRFIYKYSQKRIWAILAFVFYAICPPIVMFAMSTTKDNLCYALLLVAVLKLYDIYQTEKVQGIVPLGEWVTVGALLTLSCLMRNNIVYAIYVLLAISAVAFVWKHKKGMLILCVSVVFLQMIVNAGLAKALHAEPGYFTEALSVPFQQIARLYAEEGENAFTEEELELLYATIEPEMLETYDPMISDSIKYSFWRHLDVLTERKWEFITLWARKAMQYPGVYIDSFLDNTYQAWYPGTKLASLKRTRYFDVSGWQYNYGRPKWQGLFDYYESLAQEDSYAQYPVLRLFFSTGTMLWTFLIAGVYCLWRKNTSLFKALLLVLLVCGTNFLGPVSDIRYYLILFYMFPVCVGILFSPKKNI